MSISLLLNNTFAVACLNATGDLLPATSKAAEKVGLTAESVPDCDSFSFQVWKLVCSAMSPDAGNDDDPVASDDDDANSLFSGVRIGSNDTYRSLVDSFGSQACQANPVNNSSVQMIAIVATVAILTCAIFYFAMASYCDKRKADGKPACLSLPSFWSRERNNNDVDERTPINGANDDNVGDRAACCR
jgi:hypothetical protein